ncbi:MAG: hypothetical protein RLZZ127_2923 [Planctomycetota bacterium]|jgi:trans-2-enoyl-CoA reductase
MPRALRFASCGDPLAVLSLDEVPDREPGPGEIAVRMRWAPINPADGNFIAGVYGRKPDLPAVAGLEGVGEVTAVGAGVTGFAVGDLARPVDGVGAWRTAATAAAERFHRLPPLRDLQQAAMLAVNPATAWRLLHDIVPLRPGDWVVLNAGTSNVGRCVIQLCRHLGLRSISLVRRAEAIPELTALGGDAVLLDDRGAVAAIADRTGDRPPRLAINQVGGDSALTLAKAVAPGGTVATIGAMARQPVTVPAGLLIFKDVRFTGYWVTTWYRTAAAAERDAMFARLAALVDAGTLLQPVAATYPLTAWRDAIAHAGRDGRGGKVMLDLG